jgi:hypothetical protein
MWTVEGELEKALNILALPESELRKCNDEEAVYVVNIAMETFVKDHPRVWWLSLKTPFNAFSYAQGDAYKHLVEYIPNNEKRCWFVAIVSIIKLLEECCFFEYYLVDKNFNWLIIENDHNELIVARRALT